MATGGIFLFGTTGGSSGNSSDLVIDADTQDYNVLTAATAAGYDNSAGTDFTITVTINSGVNVTASLTGNTAFTTGALNANTTLRIINNGNIEGHVGSQGSNGGTGGAGGKGIYFNTLTGGSATHSMVNNGTVFGGGGGGGGYGRRTGTIDDDGSTVCGGTIYSGSNGASGARGLPGVSGTLPSAPPSDSSCTQQPSPGGPGAAGISLDKNGRTVTTTGSGSYLPVI